MSIIMSFCLCTENWYPQLVSLRIDSVSAKCGGPLFSYGYTCRISRYSPSKPRLRLFFRHNNIAIFSKRRMSSRIPVGT